MRVPSGNHLNVLIVLRGGMNTGWSPKNIFFPRWRHRKCCLGTRNDVTGRAVWGQGMTSQELLSVDRECLEWANSDLTHEGSNSPSWLGNSAISRNRLLYFTVWVQIATYTLYTLAFSSLWQLRWVDLDRKMCFGSQFKVKKAWWQERTWVSWSHWVCANTQKGMPVLSLLSPLYSVPDLGHGTVPPMVSVPSLLL